MNKLAKEKEPAFVPIRCVIASYEDTPKELLVELAKDEDWEVRRGVANNSNTPPETLATLAKDEYVAVRKTVAYNPNTPPETLAELARDIDSNVQKAALANPNYDKTASLDQLRSTPLKERKADAISRSQAQKQNAPEHDVPSVNHTGPEAK